MINCCGRESVEMPTRGKERSVVRVVEEKKESVEGMKDVVDVDVVDVDETEN